MALVPQETYQVLHCKHNETAIEDEPEITAWVKRTKINPVHPFVVWAKGDTSELTQLYQDLPKETTHGYPSSGISFGRAMISPSIDITTAGGENLPRYLWRATHDGQPYGGLRSRGQNGAPPPYFAAQFILHCNWKSRDPSPFMSWTSEKGSAYFVAASYQARGYNNVKVTRVDTQGEGWDRERQKIWRVASLVNALKYPGLAGRDVLMHEYLIENSVPEEAIESFNWLALVKKSLEAQDKAAFVRSRWNAHCKAVDAKKKEKQKEKDDEIDAYAKEYNLSRDEATEWYEEDARERRSSCVKTFRRRYKEHKRLLQRRS
ncbi:hypothetical protein PFICI_01411 [Pestalotiopsis fici W106-1]|uniref:DUF7587 domain-containing protein n=1 Tax=Pestalotiopsis fici (strain W106-1 / CGMCC3.15140) TaxID=1229662 RepID=W3XNE9_PESFW|nr:uncharacterized protein PFICI_01411 [Pestalotiopsis fici W106-1]ETS87583.1 hypothetical protein PFICI_01411 [Pestalotiopsis fici W106-1]